MTDDVVGVALVGAGRIGSSHARILAEEVPRARLVGVVDPRTEAATALAGELGCEAYGTAGEALVNPEVEAVVVTTPADLHREVVLAAAAAGKHVFCEKPLTKDLPSTDECIAACEAAGVVLQVGFNRRFARGFAAARRMIDDGRVGTPQLLRSLTRDPGPFRADPARIPDGTIFYETLIHDFDALLWLNPGASPVRVHAFADALVRPDAKGAGFLDTAVVTVTFDNGAIATADASFCARYGYDVRGEVFGSGGMVTTGAVRSSDMDYYGPDGLAVDTSRMDTDLLFDAYRDEFRAFVAACRGEDVVVPTGADARAALLVALAALRSAREGRDVQIAEVAS